jgi:hypothetical protein
VGVERRPGEPRRLVVGFMLCMAGLIFLLSSGNSDDVSLNWLVAGSALMITGTVVLLWDDWHRPAS